MVSASPLPNTSRMVSALQSSNIDGNSSLQLSWRIYPPPEGRRRKTKQAKGRKRNHQQFTKGDDKELSPDQQQLSKQKELWRQKQQQYQYTYPYRVGDPVILMVPRNHCYHQDKRFMDNDIEATLKNSNKKRKIDARSRDNNNTPIQRNGASVNQNYLVPIPGTVVKIEDSPNESQNRLVHVMHQCYSSGSSEQIAILSPKEQRKRLCPDLSPRRNMATPKLSTSHDSGSCCSVVLVEETLPFRQLVRFQLHNQKPMNDRVLEIGCSTGELSKLIWKNHTEDAITISGTTIQPTLTQEGPSWIGMDHSQEMIDACSKQLQQHKATVAAALRDKDETGNNHHGTIKSCYQAKVVRVNTLEEPKRAFREAINEKRMGPTVVLIDIGGNRECGPVVQTIAWVLEVFGKDLAMVVVKSRALVRQLLSDCCQREQLPPSHNVTQTTIKNSDNNTPGLDASSGLFREGTKWFRATQQRLQYASQQKFRQRFKHPLKAPKVLSPVDGCTPICRYHNYHPDGCKLYQTASGNANDKPNQQNGCMACPFDHDHCHACLERGHVAKDCPKAQSCY